MKRSILSFLGLIGIVFAQGNFGLVLEPVITVANGSIYDNNRPQIALATNGTPLVVWGSNVGGNKGFVSRFDAGAFTTPFRISPGVQINAYTVEGPNIAASDDYAYAVYTKTPTNSSSIFIVRSTDAGLTWEAPRWVDSLTSGIPNFANVATMPDGNPLVLYMRQSSSWANPRWVMRKSTDFGMTWLPEVPVSASAPGGKVCDCCMGQIYGLSNRIVGIFRNEENNLRDMWATSSIDNGLTFGAPTDLDATDWVIAACPMSGPQAMFVGDSIYSVFMSEGGNGEPRIYLSGANLSDSTMAWNRFMLDTNNQIIQNYPTIAGNGDTMIVAWMQSNGSNAEIALRWSLTGPNGLQDHDAIYVTDWAAGTQTFPDIAWENGKLYIVWQDNTNNTIGFRTASFGILANLDNQDLIDWKIGPNPTSNFIRLTDLPAFDGELQILDVQGKLVFKQDLKGEKEMQLNLAHLPNGKYFVRIAGAEFQSRTKAIVILH